MSDIVHFYLGLRGYFMQIKIECCASFEQLMNLLPDLEAAVSKSHGVEVAAHLVTRINQAAGLDYDDQAAA